MSSSRDAAPRHQLSPDRARAVVDRLRSLEEAKARIAAQQARLAVELDEIRRAEHQALRLPRAQQGRGVDAEVALARRESPWRGGRLLGLGKALVREMPHTLAALEAGLLSEWRATIVTRETAILEVEDRRRIDTELFGTPEAARRAAEWGDRQLAAQVRRAAQALDPEAEVDRRRRVEAERRISLRPAPDTMSILSGLLPVAQGVAVYASLVNAAKEAAIHGDPRTRGQVMADTLVERVTGQARAHQVPVAVQLTISDQALLAGGSEPAWLTDHGPLPAGVARDLAATAVREATATLRRLYVTPTDGQLVALESTARIFPKGLGLFLELRDQICRTPWCDAPVRHHDHVAAWERRGPTSSDNGQGLCEHCNHTKQAPGWSAHVVETVSPTGHRHRSRSPGLPSPARHRRAPVTMEIYHREAALAHSR